jgi:hypothetical protein
VSTQMVYLIVSADQSVRVTKRFVPLRPDEVAIPIRLRFPDGWGKPTAMVEIALPDGVPAVDRVDDALGAEQ